METKMDSQRYYPLDYYIAAFRTMNCNKQKGQVAPHKAIMLLTVITAVSEGKIEHGIVTHKEWMVRSFEQLWKKYVGVSSVFKPTFATPFFHLAYESFWELVKTSDYEDKREYSLSALRKSFLGARLDTCLWNYMQDADCRHKLKQALLEKFFPNCNGDEYRMVAEVSCQYTKKDNENVIIKNAA